jgi:hypothetical protein
MRRSALVALLATIAILAACSDQTSSSQSQQATQSAAATATIEASEAPGASMSAVATESSGGDSALLDLIPEQVGGSDRTVLSDDMGGLFAGALAGSGVDASEVDYVVVGWGANSELVLSAFRAPGIDEASLRALAQMMSGAQNGGAEMTPATVGGKSVLTFAGDETEETIYLYFTDDAAFTVVGKSPELADELLSKLP